MSASDHKAVFLSYASQDAEAAKRICDALRAAGVEVWFDQSELVGGDAWDAKIRKQIKDCALLIPIISAATQARTEGYFRLEWRLADQRTHLMAKGRPFLLPVVIDDTRDAEAHVPDSFTEVQWTRLPGGEGSAAFAARVKKLLSGDAEVRGQTSEFSGQKTQNPEPRTENRRLGRLWWALPIFGVTMALVLVLKEGRKDPAPPPATSQPAALAPVSEAQKLVQQARQIYEGGDEINRENIVFAEDLVKRALALEPAEPGAWELAAKLSHALVWYSLDASESRRELLMQQANRARALAPQSVSAQLVAIDARLALNFGRVAVPPDFENEVRDLVTREPGNWNAQRAWSTMLRFISGRQEESLAAIRRAVELSNGYPGVVADLINTLVRQRKFAEADAVMARYLPANPTGRMLCWDVILRLRWRGGPAAAQQSLARFPTWLLQEDRGLFLAWQTWYWSRDSAKALRAAQAAQRDYVRDFSFYGPRAVLTAQAHELAGSLEAARADWQTALARAERELATDAQTEDALYWKAWALARLGRTPEARTITAQLRQRNRDGLSAFFKGTSLSALLATTGEVDEALAEITTRLNTLDDSIGVTRPTLELDPAYDAMRGDPRFKALLKQAPAPDNEKQASAPPADEKSVAVLAFANLSDDKANEYFSDGISEELLNVLAKVPGLKVSARTSAFFFKGKEVPIPEIAKQLGVAYVVEGSVRKQGDKVRITAQLIKAADGFHVWSDTFTRDLKDIFAVQDEIARVVAENLSLRLGADRSALGQATVPEAFELYVKGRAAWNLRTREGYVQAESLLSRAIDLDPGFARAHSALADVWMIASYENESGGGTYGWRNSPTLARITAKAEQALALDPHSAEAHTSLASALEFSWKWAEAERAYRRAIELNPNYATARHWFGLILWVQGKMDDALQQLKLAAESDPLSHRILDTYARMLNLAGRPHEALAVADKALALQPMAIQAATQKAYALALLGRKNEAVALLEQIDALNPNITQRTEVLVIMQLAGADADVRRIVGSVAELPPSQFRFTSLIALGRVDEALAELRPADLHEFQLVNIALFRIYDPVREDPRFLRVINEVGYLEHYQRARAWQTANSSKSKK